MNSETSKMITSLTSSNQREVWDAAQTLSATLSELMLRLFELLTHEQSNTRAAAAYVLGMGRFAPARPLLEGVLDSCDEDPIVRGHAAEALGYIQDKASVEILVRHLDDTDPGVKYWCVFALGKLRDARAISALERLANSVGELTYNEHSLRSEAMDAIGQIQGD